MADAPRGFGEQLFQRLQGKGLSRAEIYKALALQRLADEVMELGAQGKLQQAALVEISKIHSPARQKQLAEIAIGCQLSNSWIKELARLVRNAEKTANDKEANRYWDFFFEIKDTIEREGATKEILDRVKSFSVAKEEAAATGDRTFQDFRKFELQLGRGLDVGTSNIVASARTAQGRTLYNIQRNAFLDVRNDTFTKKKLMQLGVDHIAQGDKGYVIGDHAFELAVFFEKNCRRPMRDGMISPTEHEALLIENLIIGQLLGPPAKPGEICSFSVPADPIDAERNVIYHRGAIESILRKLGYEPKAMVEGHAVVLGELTDEDYTGIGISCGAGMFNVCIAYRSMPALSFSTSRGGDWIDNNVAQALGMTSSHVCAAKESGVDLNRPRDRVEDAIAIYYRELIHYSLETIRQKFESAQNMPHFPNPISIICAGGTSMIKGFIDTFREEFQKINFPMAVKEIRLSKDPLMTVSLGCLADALEETASRARSEEQTGPINLGRTVPSKTEKATRRVVVDTPPPPPQAVEPPREAPVLEAVKVEPIPPPPVQRVRPPDHQVVVRPAVKLPAPRPLTDGASPPKVANDKPKIEPARRRPMLPPQEVDAALERVLGPDDPPREAEMEIAKFEPDEDKPSAPPPKKSDDSKDFPLIS
ncbi:MAG: hypothetical protein HYY16_06470 [Planctomycetes bacterium]|nr:hypothetical protein [Planctomycetota bacterium]